MANKVYEIVLDNIIKAMDQGIVPWTRPWKGDCEHKNIITNIPYHGANVMMLNVDSFKNKYKYPFWVTWNQAKKKKWNIKKGAKTSIIVWVKPYEKEIENENGTTGIKTVRVLRYYRVFNIRDIEGYEDIIADKIGVDVSGKPDIELAKRASMLSAYLKGEGIVLKNDVQGAYYVTGDDIINMPVQSSFNSDDAYYQALSHEIVHSTGSPKRLKRFGDWSESKKEYSQEELIAEIGSALLCADMGIKVDYKNTASYIAGWSKYLKSERKTVIFSASKQAEKAIEFVKKRAVIGAIESAAQKGVDNV